MFTFFDNNVRGGNICEPKLPTAISPNSSRNILMEQGTKGTVTFHAPLVFDFLTKPKGFNHLLRMVMEPKYYATMLFGGDWTSQDA